MSQSNSDALAIAERLGSKVAAAQLRGELSLLHMAPAESVMSAAAVEAGLSRAGVSFSSVSSGTAFQSNEPVLIVGTPDSEVLAQLVEAKPSEVVLCMPCSPSGDFSSWVSTVSLASSELLPNGYRRTLEFRSIPGVAYFARYSHLGADESWLEPLLAYEVELARMEAQKASELIAETMDSSLVDEHMGRLIGEAEQAQVDAQLRAYVAQDALSGAHAQKARAEGVAAEATYRIEILEKEMDHLIDMVEAGEGAAPADAPAAKPSLKSRVRSTPFGAVLAAVTRPVRKALK